MSRRFLLPKNPEIPIKLRNAATMR